MDHHGDVHIVPSGSNVTLKSRWKMRPLSGSVINLWFGDSRGFAKATPPGGPGLGAPVRKPTGGLLPRHSASLLTEDALPRRCHFSLAIFKPKLDVKGSRGSAKKQPEKIGFCARCSSPAVCQFVARCGFSVLLRPWLRGELSPAHGVANSALSKRWKNMFYIVLSCFISLTGWPKSWKNTHSPSFFWTFFQCVFAFFPKHSGDF